MGYNLCVRNQSNNKHMFFVFDGVDGSGKSTQLNLFTDWLREQKHDVVACNDPGTTELGEKLREILLGKSEAPIHMRSEVMLFTTARTQLVQQIIRPALEAGKTVVLDRFVLSTVVYQGHAGKLDPLEISKANQSATGGLSPPDQTFIFDLPADVAMQRLGDVRDRVESRGLEYFEKVREGFLKEARTYPSASVIDASQSIDEIAKSVRTIAQTVIETHAATKRSG